MRIQRKILGLILLGVIAIEGFYIYRNHFYKSTTDINRMISDQFYKTMNKGNIIIEKDTTNEEYTKFKLYDKETKICYYCTVKSKSINYITYGLNRYYKVEADFYASGNQLALPFGDPETSIFILDNNGDIVNNDFLKDKNWNILYGYHINEKSKKLQSYEEFKNNLNNY